MSCVHPSLAAGIGIEGVVAMGRVAEHLPPALARHHSTISSTLRQGSAKSGCHARTADHRARKRGKMPRHDRCMSRSDLVARVDEQLHSDWPPEQSAGRLRLDYPEDAGHAQTLGDHPRWSYLRAYLCGPHAPWQCGSNENEGGLLRQYFPRGSSLRQSTGSSPEGSSSAA